MVGLVQLRFFLLGLYKSFHRDQPKFPSPPSLAGICQLPNLAGKNLSVLKASRIHASIGQGVTSPPSQFQDSRVEYGEGGALSRNVTNEHRKTSA